MSISEKLREILQIKSDLKIAISNKGVEITENLPFNKYAIKIGEISGGASIITMTQAEYDELPEKDPNTLYAIVG